jgi:hypothetical protein
MRIDGDHFSMWYQPILKGVEQKFVPLHDQIEKAKNALLSNDRIRALDGLNAINTELFE